VTTFLLSLVGGGIGFILISVTVLGGFKVIKMDLKKHRAFGIACMAWALLHGTGALLMYLGIL